MIYFVQYPEDRYIKIGTTNDLSTRFQELCDDYGIKLQLLGVHEGGYRTETELHTRFSKYWRFGEWFKPSDELMTYIRDNTTLPQLYSRTKNEQHIKPLIYRIPTRVPELIRKKLGDGHDPDEYQIAKQLRLPTLIIHIYVNGLVEYPDRKILEIWCGYFDCPLEDLISLDALESIPKEKICHRCDRSKSLSDFYITYHGTITHICKTCKCEIVRESRPKRA